MSYQPRGRTFDQFNLGDTFVCPARTVTEADTVKFAGVSGDYNPLHMDEEYGRASIFGGRIAHGLLVLAIATGQANQLGLFEGTTVALLEQTARYTGAVKFGDTVHLEFKIVEKKETSKPDRGILTVETTILNQDDRPVIEGRWVLMLKRGQA